MKWRLRPYLEVELVELRGLSNDLANLKEASEPSQKRRRARLIDRHRHLMRQLRTLTEGFQLLDILSDTTLPNEETRLGDLIVAMSSFALLACNDSNYAASNFGGALEAYCPLNIKVPGVYKILFGLPKRNLNAFLKKEKLESLLALAASNRPLLNVKQSLLAAHFVPLLVMTVIDRFGLDGDVIANRSEQIDSTLHLANWELGVH